MTVQRKFSYKKRLTEVWMKQDAVITESDCNGDGCE